MAHLLVTGGAGFIGSHVAAALLARGDRVTVVDNFNAFYDPSIKRRNAAALAAKTGFTLVEGDICDGPRMDALFAEQRFDAVIHLAAWAGVRPSLEQPLTYTRNNVDGTTCLFEAARNHTPKTRFVMASSSSVYGGVNDVPFREDMDVDRPISVYAATKRACEIMARTYNTLYGMNLWCLRFFTCYGPSQRPDLAIHKFTRLIYEGKPLPFYGDGSASRDYLYIDDCVAGVLAASDRCNGYEVVNLGEERTVRLDELVAILEKQIGKRAVLQRLPNQPGDVPRTCADVTKARRLLGYQPTTAIETGIARFLEWYRAANS
jgi:UDP-glucuronate 4-epimerase